MHFKFLLGYNTISLNFSMQNVNALKCGGTKYWGESLLSVG
jgi:hypothetical protein